MADKLLRHKPSGILYVYQPVFALRDDFEEVEPETPEPVVVAPVAKKPRAKKSDADVAAEADAALSVDASRDLP